MESFEDLFKSGKEPKTEKEMIRSYVKVQALEACEPQHTKLMECYQQSWFPICRSQQQEFWKCYKDTTIELRKKHAAYF